MQANISKIVSKLIEPGIKNYISGKNLEFNVDLYETLFFSWFF